MVEYLTPERSRKTPERFPSFSSAVAQTRTATGDSFSIEATRRSLARLREGEWLDRIEESGALPDHALVPTQTELLAEVPRNLLTRAAKAWAEELLSCYEWKLFVTLTFRPGANHREPAPEAAEKATRAWLAEIHEELYGAENFETADGAPIGIRYVLAIERGEHDHRVHCHLLLAGGDRVAHAKWSTWSARWWKQQGFNVISKPRKLQSVQDYCSKYVIKDGEINISSTWEDGRARIRAIEAPLFDGPRAIGQEIAPSASWQHRGKFSRAIADGAPCRTCGMISLCRCGSEVSLPGDQRSSARFNGPEPNAANTRKQSAGAPAVDEIKVNTCTPSAVGATRLQQRGMFSPLLRGGAAPKTVLAVSSRRADRKRERGRTRYHMMMSRSSTHAAAVFSSAAAAH